MINGAQGVMTVVEKRVINGAQRVMTVIEKKDKWSSGSDACDREE
jgi:hypothetical protein